MHEDDHRTDNVLVMAVDGCSGRRIDDSVDNVDRSGQPGCKTAQASWPVLVEVMVDREANTSVGTSIAAVREFVPVP